MPSGQNDTESGPKAGTATRRRGQARVENILRSAQSLLISEGYSGLTLRKVANRLGMSLGNLTYYFPTKDKLLQSLIADLLAAYHAELEREQRRFPDDPEGRLLAYLEYLIADCKNKETRATFFQIWGLATHLDNVNALRDQIYESFRDDALALIRPLNPGVDEASLNKRVAALIAFIEGLHVIFDLGDHVLALSPDADAHFRDLAYGLVTASPN